MADKRSIFNVHDPKLWSDPRTISLNGLQSYSGVEHAKLKSSFKNYRASLLYIGGTLFGFLVAKTLTDSVVKETIFGENQNGGTILRMRTKNTIGDYTYNRQFQRMKWLAEEKTGDDPLLRTSPALMVDLGVKEVQLGAQFGVRKLVPHDKYLI